MEIKRRYLTVEEIHEYSGLSTSYIYRKVEAYDIPHFRQGSKILFDVVEFDNWMSKTRVKPKRKLEQFATASPDDGVDSHLTS